MLTMSGFGRHVPGTLRQYRWRVIAISLGHLAFQRDDAMQNERPGSPLLIIVPLMKSDGMN